jgi:L-ascorbate metabolism protein UlaG (beta-lactamase superfamily)
VALLPIWGWGPSVGSGHLDPERAARALTLLRPRLAVPIHWGTFYPVGLRRLRPDPLVRPPLEFARLARDLAPDVEVRVLQPGSETSLESG